MSDIIRPTFGNQPVTPAPEDDGTRVAWICMCGNSTFTLLEHGDAECAHCGKMVGIDGPNNWATFLPEVPEEVPVPETVRKVVDMDDPRYNMKACLDWVDINDTAYVLILQHNGDVHWWGASQLSDQERLDWFNSRVDRCRQSLLTRANFVPEG